MKSLFYGIGVATLSGLLIGGVLRPTLAEGRIGGPQIAIGDSGRLAYGDAEGGTTSYPYGVPDYVIGTDNLYQPVDYIPTQDAYVDTAWREAAPDLPVVEPASYTPATYRTAAYDAVVRYPSQGGGILGGLSSDQAPADLGPEVFEPADAPPTAMAAFERDEAAASGDTSRMAPQS
ncbi:MAG: hypothetical protein JWR84_4061 [Caulobacter sp.]|nr:hypothetical protein [Caulobacter sp.]